MNLQESIRVYINKQLGQSNQLKGGKGDTLEPSEVDQNELAKGIQHEMEHTDDSSKAEEIALDHLAENPKYYTELDASGVGE